MNNLGVATSRCSSYNPLGNRQSDKYNDVIWSAVKLTLNTRNLPVSPWEVFRQTCCTQYDRCCVLLRTFLKFQRRSALGTFVTSRLNDGAKFLVKRHTRSRFQ